MITLDEALTAYGRHIAPLATETVAIQAAHHRVLAQSPVAALDLPRFDTSAMDGYALRASDAAQSRELATAGVATPGEHPPQLVPGTATRIYTGAAIPAGADAVVPQEWVDTHGDSIVISGRVDPGANIRRHAEELSAGTAMAHAGARMTSGLLAASAMAGVATVAVNREPRIAVLITGDEVRTPGDDLGATEIADANGPLITACLHAWGFKPAPAVHVGDRRESTETALSRALAEADLVLTSGGASVGDRDFIPEAARAVGVAPVFRQVAQKPGKPVFFGVRGDAAVLGLPGNPAAVLTGLVVHAKCILDRMTGSNTPAPAWRIGRLTTPETPDHRRDRLLRMQTGIDRHGTVRLAPLTGQQSHMLGNLAQANALVRIGAGETTLEAGTALRWLPLPDTDLPYKDHGP